jgi:pilus assembly protein CpaC
MAGSGSKALAIELSEGRLLRLARPASSVFIANPEIADVSVQSPRLVYVFGRRPGETTLYAIDGEDNVILGQRVLVSHNLSRLNEELARLVPNGQITASSIDGGIVLSGSVPDADMAENARRLASRFLGDTEDLINRISVTAARSGEERSAHAPRSDHPRRGARLRSG